MDLKNYKKIVIKLGSSLSIDADSYEFRDVWLSSFFADIAKLRKQGFAVILVVSGSIACGCRELGIKREDLTLTDMQAVASYGQTFLVNHLREIALEQNNKISQILLTHDDYNDRNRYLNLRKTVSRLLEMNIIPVINENDSVVNDEIRFSDNDYLSSLVTQLVGADLLFILSDVAGFYDKNPKIYADAKLIREITDFSDDLFNKAQEDLNKLGTGGMSGKLKAVKNAIASGADVVISSGQKAAPITHYLESKEGSFFKAKSDSRSAWKNWLTSLQICGSLCIDQGAAKALKSGNSLLAVGIVEVIGDFKSGDAVEILNHKQEKIAVGLVAFNAGETKQIMGMKSENIKNILGHPSKKNVIHADDLVIF